MARPLRVALNRKLGHRGDESQEHRKRLADDPEMGRLIDENRQK
jgi:hypothetical protein